MYMTKLDFDIFRPELFKRALRESRADALRRIFPNPVTSTISPSQPPKLTLIANTSCPFSHHSLSLSPLFFPGVGGVGGVGVKSIDNCYTI